MSCTTTDTGARVLMGRHTQECQDGEAQACPGCLPCTEDHCRTCKRNHSPDTCPACLAMARTHLSTIAELHTHLADQATNGRQAHHVHAGIPGGDAVVLLVPGPTQRETRGQLEHRERCHLDTTHTLEEQHGDPRPVLTVLVEWEAWWRAHTQAPTTLTPTVPRVADYLDNQLHHMARHDAFPRLARDLSRTVTRLETVLYDGIRPEVSRVPCLGCGVRLEKVYGAKAEEDHWRCPRCGELYDRGRFDRAKHDHLASQGAERYVALSDAVAAVGRPRATVWAWVTRGVVQVRRDPSRGTLVWWPDVRSLHLSTQSRKRRGTTP